MSSRIVRSIVGASGSGLAVAAGSVFGIALNLAMPFMLPAGEYAAYSLLLGLAQFATNLVFEWMRMGVIRHGYGADGKRAVLRREALAWGYIAAIWMLASLGLVAVIASLWIDWALGLAAVLLCMVLQGAFDGQMAAARARFDSRTFAWRWIGRAVLSCVLALMAAEIFGTGLAAFLGFSLAYPLAGLRWLKEPGRALPRHGPDFGELGRMLRFGALAAMGTNLSLAVPAGLRGLAVASLGMGGAGGVLLAIDLGQRLFATLGMAINIVVMQNAIRAVEQGAGVEIRARVRMAVVLPIATMAPVTIGVTALRSQIAQLVVPVDYQAGFVGGMAAVMLAAAILAIRQYGLDPLFLVFGKAAGAPLGAVVTLLVLLAGWLIEWGEPIQAALMPMLVASLAGLAATMIGLSLATAIHWPLGDLGGIAIALLAMAGMSVALREFDGLPGAAVIIGILSLSYGLLLLLFDVGGCRRQLLRYAPTGEGTR